MEMIEVSDIKEYIKNGIIRGQLKPFYAVETAKVTARRGKVGEIISTFSREGNYSTTKAVFRTSNGEIDWVVTNDNGDQYVVDDETFKNNYQETDVLGEYVTSKKPKLIVQIFEPIQFKNKFGNTYRVQPNYYIVIGENNDFYELTPEEFRVSYKMSKKEYVFEEDETFFDENSYYDNVETQ